MADEGGKESRLGIREVRAGEREPRGSGEYLGNVSQGVWTLGGVRISWEDNGDLFGV